MPSWVPVSLLAVAAFSPCRRFRLQSSLAVAGRAGGTAQGEGGGAARRCYSLLAHRLATNTWGGGYGMAAALESIIYQCLCAPTGGSGRDGGRFFWWGFLDAPVAPSSLAPASLAMWLCRMMEVLWPVVPPPAPRGGGSCASEEPRRPIGSRGDAADAPHLRRRRRQQRQHQVLGDVQCGHPCFALPCSPGAINLPLTPLPPSPCVCVLPRAGCSAGKPLLLAARPCGGRGGQRIRRGYHQRS